MSRKKQNQISDNVVNLATCFKAACNMINMEGTSHDFGSIEEGCEVARDLYADVHNGGPLRINKAEERHLRNTFLEMAPLLISRVSYVRSMGGNFDERYETVQKLPDRLYETSVEMNCLHLE